MALPPSDQLSLCHDLPLSGFSIARSRSCSSDSDSDWLFGRDVLDHHRRPFFLASLLRNPDVKCDRNLGWSIDWAVARCIDRLENIDATAGLRAIRARAANLETEGLVHQIPFRVFNRLDEVLFGGQLRGAVYLDVASQENDVCGTTFTHGWGLNREVKRVSIILNSNVLEYATTRDILTILIHNMIHAYFLIACGPQKEEDISYGRLQHDVHFAKILLAIQKIWHGKDIALLSLGHNVVRPPFYIDTFDSFVRHTILDRNEKDEWYRSHCHHYIPPIPTNAIEKWYEKVCLPLLDLPKTLRTATVHTYNDRRHELETEHRARLPRSAKSFEFIFADKSVLVGKNLVDNFPSIRRALDRAGCRYLVIHEDVTMSTFMRFLEFVHTGEYRPPLHSLAAAAAAASLGSIARGPPIIKVQSVGAEPHLLTDVQFAKFASLMGFDECKAYALERMNKYAVIYEDPIAILKEIYCRSEPDADLKAWAREFLMRASCEASKYRALCAAAGEPPNLVKLEDPQGYHHVKFIEALESNGALKNDVVKARAELKGKGWYTASTRLEVTYAPLGQADHAPLTPLPLTLPLPLPSTVGVHPAAPFLINPVTHHICPNTMAPPATTFVLHGLVADMHRLSLRENLRNQAQIRDARELRELDRLRDVEDGRDLERLETRMRRRGLERGLAREKARRRILERDVLREREGARAALDVLYGEALRPWAESEED